MSDIEYCKCSRRITPEILKQRKTCVSFGNCNRRFNRDTSASWDYLAPDIQTNTGTEQQENIDRQTRGSISISDQTASVEQVQPRLVTPDPDNLNNRGDSLKTENDELWETE